VTPAQRALLVALLALVVVTAACGADRDAEPSTRANAAQPAGEGRLTARPQHRVTRAAPRGRLALDHGAELYVPSGYEPTEPSAFVLTLHGANGGPANGFGRLLPLADEAGLILLAPQSQRGTWDVARGGYGPDVRVIDELLEDVFARYAVDPRRVFVSGFSDGASYALSLGLTNGDLFEAIVAFSPGFAAPARARGKPRVFVSHGTHDRTLPIDRTSRRLVRVLRDHGYRVTFREFAGPHTVPPATARAAVAWLTTKPAG
jgi:phospholipase/carboxylesterase